MFPTPLQVNDTAEMMNNVFQAAPHNNHAPKRSNSGREIVYLQNQRIMGTAQPVQSQFLPQHNPNQLTSQAIPHDVLEVFNTVFRKYPYRDLHHWLKLDRREELGRFSTASDMHAAVRTPLPSSARTSRTSSVFSMPVSVDRNSYASSRTSWSVVSDNGMGDHNSVIMSPDVMQMSPHPMDSISPLNKANRASTVPATKPAQRQRESDLEVKKRYFCTACNKGFARKYDWKVHEQRYHEQQFQYPCPDCNQILYAETHFRSHHRDAHGCAQCTHAKEVTKEVDARRRRTAWGCGFCGSLLDEWEKRCDHISSHYDEGMKRSDWDHSKVIIGLLRQPDLDGPWQNYLIERHGQVPNPPLALKFSKDTTSRSHGDNMQLQDLLELGAIDRDIMQIVELAYDQGVRQGPKAALEAKLDTVAEEQETASISPANDITQDSIMGSPPLEAATLPQPSNQNASSYFPSSPMDFTQPQQPEVQQSPMMHMNDHQMNGNLNQFYFDTNHFNDSMFPPNSFTLPSNPHHSASSFEKALPPLPVDDRQQQQQQLQQHQEHQQHQQQQHSVPSNDVQMLQSHAHTPHETHVTTFDQWPILAGAGYSNDGHHMVPVLATFDPRNQF